MTNKMLSNIKDVAMGILCLTVGIDSWNLYQEIDTSLSDAKQRALYFFIFYAFCFIASCVSLLLQTQEKPLTKKYIIKDVIGLILIIIISSNDRFLESTKPGYMVPMLQQLKTFIFYYCIIELVFYYFYTIINTENFDQQSATFSTNSNANPTSADRSFPNEKVGNQKMDENPNSTIICPSCGFEQAGNRTVCWKCAFAFKDTQKNNIENGNTSTNDTVSTLTAQKCPYCGEKITVDMTFCSYCGRKI